MKNVFEANMPVGTEFKNEHRTHTPQQVKVAYSKKNNFYI